jgi:hypothetical protein
MQVVLPSFRILCRGYAVLLLQAEKQDMVTLGIRVISIHKTNFMINIIDLHICPQ